MKAKSSPDVSRIEVMRDRPGVRYGLAGAAFLGRFSEALESLSLSPIRVLALAYVMQHAGCDQSSLGGVLGIGRASAMLLVDKLEALGYVERRAGADRRSNALFVTDAGEAAFREALRIEQFLSDQVFGWMSARQLDDLLSTIDKIHSRTRTSSLEDIQ